MKTLDKSIENYILDDSYDIAKGEFEGEHPHVEIRRRVRRISQSKISFGMKWRNLFCYTIIFWAKTCFCPAVAKHCFATALDDKMHIIYVNGQSREDSEIGKLMHDFFQSDPDKIHNPVLAERVRYLKNTEEGVGSMCRAMEEMRAEVAAEAAETERKANAEEVEKRLKAEGVSEKIIKATIACILNRTA